MQINSALKITRVTALAAIGVLLLAMSVACGSSATTDTKKDTTSQTSPSPSPSETTDPTASPTGALNLPECSTVWVTGQTLPEDYQGCTENGKFVEPDVIYCESGQSLAAYQNRYYAAMGQVINEVPNVHKTKKWRKMVRTCTG